MSGSFRLYEDQQHDFEILRELTRKHSSILLQAATGYGKTVVAGSIAQSARKKGRKILILLHRRELVRQTVDTLKRAGLGNDIGVVCNGFQPAPWSPIQVAMVFSWVRRSPVFDPDMIFIDEAHHVKAQSWHTAVEMHPNARIVGMTATPIRLDGKGMDPPFDVMHCGLSIPELVERKRLAPMRVLRVPQGFGMKSIKKRKTEFSIKAMDETITPKIVANSANVYMKYLKGKRTIVFAVSKRHAMMVADALVERGIRAAYVGDETPQGVRDATFSKFGAGLIDVVCNVGLIDEGFDVPECEAVMDMAPTASLSKFLQRAGRCTRYVAGKTATFVDGVGNTYRHGLPDLARAWNLSSHQEGNGDPVKESDPTELRWCRECLSLFDSKYESCPHCGKTHDGRPVREVDVELLEVIPEPPKPKPEPKMTAARRKALISEAGSLHRMGQSEQAWKILKETAKEAGYVKQWAHVIANIINLPAKYRK